MPVFKTRLHRKKYSTVNASITTRRNWVTTYFPNKLDYPLLVKALQFQAGNKLNLSYGLESICVLDYSILFSMWFIQLIWANTRWNQITENIHENTSVTNACVRHTKYCVYIKTYQNVCMYICMYKYHSSLYIYINCNNWTHLSTLKSFQPLSVYIMYT
jgi:hypothetical protein